MYKLYVGRDGMLSNMDFVNLPLMTPFGATSFRIEAIDLITRYRDLKKIIKTHYGMDTDGYIIRNLNAYAERLLGLVSFICTQVLGPSGLHGQFLYRNIESVTIQINRKGTKTLNGNRSRKKTNKPSQMKVSVILGTLYQLLKANSHLQEELHHSLFCYIIVSAKEFVG